MGLGRSKQNTNGSAIALLRSIKQEMINADFKSSLKNTDLRNQSNEIVTAILEQLFYLQTATGEYNLQLHSKTEDDILARIVFLIKELQKDTTTLDELKTLIQSINTGASNASEVTGSLTKNDLDQVKQEIIDFIQNHETSDYTKEELSELFENELDEDDLEDSKDLVYANKKVESLKDEKVGEYQDSTTAANFDTLTKHINDQINMLNENISKIQSPGLFKTILSSTIGVFIGNTFAKMFDIGKGFGKVVKNISSRVFNITKTISGGILKGIFKTIGGVFSIVGKIGKGIGKLGSKLFSGIKGLGSKIGGAVMSPFKAIGGFFSKLNPFGRKKEKEQAKKERAKERLMEIISNIVEKIWKVVEPFIDWVGGVIKKFIIIPITIIALKVLLIVGIIIASIAAAVILFIIIKNKIMKFIKYITSGELLKDITAGIKKVLDWIKNAGKWLVGVIKKTWSWICDFAKWLWDIIVDAVKYIFWGMWVDLGKWIWKKLCEFGNWLYNNYIGPYLVEPFKKYIWEPVKKLWNEKIWPKIKPFVESAQNLMQRLKDIWAKFKWDENKSFFENLKCLASIVKDAVLDWWNTSPFKVFYETYLEPIVKSVQDLITRIKNIWNNFNWDENKSFLENLKEFWNQCWTSIKEWWAGSVIKTYWDKLVDWITNIWNKVKEWWNNTTIGKWVNSLIEKIKEKVKIAGDIQWSLKIAKIRPFGWLVGKPTFEGIGDAIKNKAKAVVGKAQDKISETYHNNNAAIKALEEKLKNAGFFKAQAIKAELAIRKATKYMMEKNTAKSILDRKDPSLAKQQVNNAMKSINNIENERAKSNQQLNQASEEVANRVAAKETANETAQQQNDERNRALHDEIVELRRDVAETRVNNQNVAAAAAGGSMAGAASVQPQNQQYYVDF